MTEDEKAQAVLDRLGGIERCPTCGKPMDQINLSTNTGPWIVWFCGDVDGCSEARAQRQLLGVDITR